MLQRSLILLTFILMMSTVNGQQKRKERYNGTMRNGLMEPGEVTYYYYQDGRDRVLDGVFRYRLRWRNDDRQRVYQTINGSYEDGKKSGTWSYTIKVQDYFEDNEGYYYSYDVLLNASYKQGIPHGNWNLNKTSKKRKKSDDERSGWQNYEGKNNISIKLVFDQGKLVDSVLFSDKANNTLIKGKLDKKGFYHSDWINQYNGSRREESYHHGIITKRVVKTLQGKIEDEQSLMVNKDMWISYTSSNADREKLTFQPETLEVLKNPKHMIPQMINEHLFDYRLFLYSYISGDELIKDYPGKNPAALFSGLKKVNFKYRVNPQMGALLTGISQENRKVQNNYRKAVEYAKEHQLQTKQKNNLLKLERMSRLSNKYNCLSGTIKSYLNVNDGINKAYENCNLRFPIEIKLPSDLSKEELIKHIYQKVRDMNIESKKILKELS
ncbi:MAG: hypothetical protein R6T91_00665 [Bacteroidales bacterium]